MTKTVAKHSYAPHKHRQRGRFQKKNTRQYLDFLTICSEPKARQAVLATCPPQVIKTICNAALNLLEGDSVRLTPNQRRVLRPHRAFIQRLVERSSDLESKRAELVKQSGSGAGLGILLSSVIGALGPMLLNKLIGK